VGLNFGKFLALTLVSGAIGNFFNLFSGILHNFVDVALIYKQEAATGLLPKYLILVSAIGESFAMQNFCLHSKSLTFA
jgi:hypothetical protein